MIKQRTSSEYTQMLKGLLPPGQAWNIEEDSDLVALQKSAAEELARLDGDVWRLLDELNPSTTSEALSDWERVVGLPDECTALGTAFSERISAVLLKLKRPVGQNAGYYEMLASTLGYASPKVEEFRPFRAGSRANQRIYQSPGGILSLPSGGYAQSGYHGWLYAWRLRVNRGAVVNFRSSQSLSGERLATWGDRLLECIIRRLKPAHTLVIFAYGEEKGD